MKDPLLFIVIFFVSAFILFSIFIFYIQKQLGPPLAKLYRSANKKILLFFLLTLFLATSIIILYKDVQFSPTENLQSLSYLTWTANPADPQYAGVVEHDKSRAFEGLNIYNPRNLSTAYLMDMEGQIRHQWSSEGTKHDTWHAIHLCKNGDLLAIVKDKKLMMLDWNSKLKWEKKLRFHHEVTVSKNNYIFALARKDVMVSKLGLPLPVLNDYIVIMSPDGKIKKKISLYKILKDQIPLNRIAGIYLAMLNPQNIIKMLQERRKKHFLFHEFSAFDIFHTNTITIIDQDIPGLCQKGNLLISISGLDLVIIFDVTKNKIVWQWGPGHLSKQHFPTLLNNGHILIFDNGVKRKYSRIIELDPLTKKIVWEYKANPPDSFFSLTRGACQRLPNGNTLITNSNSGFAFEITPEGKTAWKFYDPEVNENHRRATIYRLLRITDPENYSKIKDLKN